MSDIKSKNNFKSLLSAFRKKLKEKRRRKALLPDEKMSTKIVKDFLRFNLFAAALLLFLYALAYLAARQYDFVYYAMKNIIVDIFGNYGEKNLVPCSLYILLGVYVCLPLWRGASARPCPIKLARPVYMVQNGDFWRFVHFGCCKFLYYG